MKPRTITFYAPLSDTLGLHITGRYTPPYQGSWEEPPEAAQFEYQKVEFDKGDVAELLDYIDNFVDNKTSMSEWMEQLGEKFYNED